MTSLLGMTSDDEDEERRTEWRQQCIEGNRPGAYLPSTSNSDLNDEVVRQRSLLQTLRAQLAERDRYIAKLKRAKATADAKRKAVVRQFNTINERYLNPMTYTAVALQTKFAAETDGVELYEYFVALYHDLQTAMDAYKRSLHEAEEVDAPNSPIEQVTPKRRQAPPPASGDTTPWKPSKAPKASAPSYTQGAVWRQEATRRAEAEKLLSRSQMVGSNTSSLWDDLTSELYGAMDWQETGAMHRYQHRHHSRQMIMH